jgi:hypothetical protein
MTTPITTSATFRQGDPWSRRRFLSSLAASALGVAAAPGLVRAGSRVSGAAAPGGLAGMRVAGPAAPGPAVGLGPDDAIPLLPATAKQVIYLYMAGGMSHLDTFDPKPGAETQGPTQAIPTSADGVQIGGGFRLLARHMDKLAVVRSMRTTQGAHAQGTYTMHTSYELRGTIRHPSLGAWAERMLGRIHPSLPGHVVVRGGSETGSSGFFPPQYLPLPIGDPEAGLQDASRPEHVDDATWLRRLERLEAMNGEFLSRWNHDRVLHRAEVFDQALALMGSADLAAFDLSAEPEPVRAAYGEDRFGQGCLLARRLVEHGVRFVEVVAGGWDMHSDLEERLEEVLPPVDRALAALMADLDQRGLLDETLVVVATEFGRTPKIRADRGGRDHFPAAFSCLLGGGGIAGGQAFGATDALGERAVGRAVTVNEFNATIAHALGLPGEHELYSPEGRPFTVADKGRPVTELFA